MAKKQQQPPRQLSIAEQNEIIQELIVVDIYLQCDRCLTSSATDIEDGLNLRKIAKRLMAEGWELRNVHTNPRAYCPECAKDEKAT